MCGVKDVNLTLEVKAKKRPGEGSLVKMLAS